MQLSEIVGVLLMQPLTRMKSKIYLLTLLVSVGLIAADEPASTAPSNPPAKADNPPAKPGKKKDKGPKIPDGVSEADWKSLLEARKAAATDPAVVAAQAELDTAKNVDNTVSCKSFPLNL